MRETDRDRSDRAVQVINRERSDVGSAVRTKRQTVRTADPTLLDLPLSSLVGCIKFCADAPLPVGCEKFGASAEYLDGTLLADVDR